MFHGVQMILAVLSAALVAVSSPIELPKPPAQPPEPPGMSERWGGRTSKFPLPVGQAVERLHEEKGDDVEVLSVTYHESGETLVINIRYQDAAGTSGMARYRWSEGRLGGFVSS